MILSPVANFAQQESFYKGPPFEFFVDYKNKRTPCDKKTLDIYDSPKLSKYVHMLVAQIFFPAIFHF